MGQPKAWLPFAGEIMLAAASSAITGGYPDCA
jgi:hypothetical protein